MGDPALVKRLPLQMLGPQILLQLRAHQILLQVSRQRPPHQTLQQQALEHQSLQVSPHQILRQQAPEPQSRWLPLCGDFGEKCMGNPPPSPSRIPHR